MITRKKSVAGKQQAEAVQGLVDAGAVIDALLQEALDMRVQPHRAVELHIVALGVGAEQDQRRVLVTLAEKGKASFESMSQCMEENYQLQVARTISDILRVRQ